MHYASRLKYFLCRKICRSINHKMTFHNATELSDRIHPERVLHVFIHSPDTLLGTPPFCLENC